jgi:hypothetical protein
MISDFERKQLYLLVSSEAFWKRLQPSKGSVQHLKFSLVEDSIYENTELQTQQETNCIEVHISGLKVNKKYHIDKYENTLQILIRHVLCNLPIFYNKRLIKIYDRTELGCTVL